MGVKILFFSRGTLGQNSMFPEKGGQNSIFFPSALKKGGQNRGAYQPTSLKGCPPGCCPQVNMTWLHHWWVNIGLNNDLVSSGTKSLLCKCLAKFVCHYLGANELIYSQTVAELTDFYLVVCMASNLIFRKQRYLGRLGRRSYIYPTWQFRVHGRYLINIDPGSLSPGL